MLPAKEHGENCTFYRASFTLPLLPNFRLAARLGTSDFATSSAERSVEREQGFQATQGRPLNSQGLASGVVGGGE